MLIIVEGQERTGKTTLCSALAKEFIAHGQSAEVKKFERCDDVPMGIIKKVFPLAQERDKIWIVDRCHITEIVYRTYDGSQMFNSDFLGDLYSIDTVLKLLNSVHIFLFADEETLEIRHEQTNREFAGHITTIKEIFEASMAISEIPCFSYDTSKKTTDLIVNSIIDRWLKGNLFS